MCGTPFIASVANTSSSCTVMIVGTSCGNVVASIGSRTPSGSTIEGQASTTVVVSRAAAWNSNAFTRSGAPSLARRADTLTGLTVVGTGSWTKSRNVVASVSNRAPSSSSFECQAIATVIVGCTTAGNLNTGLSCSAPSITTGTQAFSCRAIMTQRTSSRNIVASIGSSAPSSIGFESQASSTVVMSGTAAWNGNARIGSGTPRLVNRASAETSGAVMASESRAQSGQIVASVSGGTPISSSIKGQAVSARIISSAAARNFNALLLRRTPLESCIANALTTVVVIQRAINGNDRAGVGRGTPSCSLLKSQTFSTSIALNAAVGNFDAALASGTPRESGIANTLTAVIMRIGTVSRDGEA